LFLNAGIIFPIIERKSPPPDTIPPAIGPAKILPKSSTIFDAAICATILAMFALIFFANSSNVNLPVLIKFSNDSAIGLKNTPSINSLAIANSAAIACVSKNF